MRNLADCTKPRRWGELHTTRHDCMCAQQSVPSASTQLHSLNEFTGKFVLRGKLGSTDKAWRYLKFWGASPNRLQISRICFRAGITHLSLVRSSSMKRSIHWIFWVSRSFNTKDRAMLFETLWIFFTPDFPYYSTIIYMLYYHTFIYWYTLAPTI